jgi:pyruvate dehydrogenase E2 component (dihydrolipoamide acetyltransferase)
MAKPVEMPQLGNTVEECLLTRWLKQVGDSVSVGDMVAEIETDKTTFEVTSPVDGTLLATFFDEGALVPVFTNIFVVGDPGESVDEFRPGGRSVAAEAAVVSAPATSTVAARESRAANGGRTAVSPRAAQLGASYGIDPASLTGSGPGGRVLERDVRNASQSPQKREPRTTGLRATIARRMRESLATTAQFTLHSSADATTLLALRAQLKDAANGAHLTINDLVVFCTVRALLQAPELNAELIDGELVRHAHVNLAFAVDTPRGLVAPVVRRADAMRLRVLAASVRTLAARAIDGTIAPDDLTGATFTISNLGALGIESFTPIVNPPQVAILGVDAIQLKPVRRNGAVEFVDAIGLSLTCDHQAIDGAPGARFLQVLRREIENVQL